MFCRYGLCAFLAAFLIIEMEMEEGVFEKKKSPRNLSLIGGGVGG